MLSWKRGLECNTVCRNQRQSVSLSSVLFHTCTFLLLISNTPSRCIPTQTKVNCEVRTPAKRQPVDSFCHQIIMQGVTRRALGGASLVRRAGGATVPVASAGRRSYHDNIVEHYENPRNVGSMDKSDKFVGTVSREGLIHF